MGSVYDEFNLGNGYENIYTAIPGAAGANDTVTDTLVTPSGNVNLDSLFGSFNAADPLNPGDAFTGLDVSDISGAADAFSIGGFTLDPNWRPGARASTRSPAGDSLRRCWRSAVDTLVIRRPVQPSLPKASMSYSGTGSSATDIGTITTGEDVTNLLGFTNTELIVTDVTPADGADAPRTCRRSDRSTTRSTWATGTRTSTPRSRVRLAGATPSPTPW